MKHARACEQTIVIGQDGAAFAGVKIFELIETERARVADGTLHAVLVANTNRLACVFDYDELILASQSP